jgi:hypothetical protein
MNKAHFQTMFGTTTGNVYRFVGEIPEEQDPTSLMTEKIIEASGTNLASIVVVNTRNMFVLYSDFTGILTSSDFELITDLTPDPVIEVTIPEPEATPPEEV